MLSRFLFQEELQLNQVKHKQLPRQVLFATQTQDDQLKLKPVHYLSKIETVLPSLKNDCHPSLAHSGNDQFPSRDNNEGEKIVIKTLDSFSFDAVHPIEIPCKKPITKNAKTLIQQFFSDGDNEDPVGSRELQEKNL